MRPSNLILCVTLGIAACVPATDEPDDADTGDSDGASEGGTDVPATCPAPSGGPSVATDVTVDTTWTAAGSPWRIESGISIRAALTIEPCAEVLIGGGVTVTVRDAGSVVGIGTAEQPIHIGAIDPESPWASLHIYHGNPITLAHTTIEDGGEPGAAVVTSTAMIVAQAVDADSHETLDFDHVTLRGSASQGALLIDGARFSSASTGLTASDNASYPVVTWANGLSTLPEGDYAGNGVDAVLVIGSGAGSVDEDVTIHDRGVPYVIGDGGSSGQLRVEGAQLTIEPGVELRFGRDGGLHVDYGSYAGVASGALRAVGTADAPIVFTSAASTPAPGDWYGIYLWNQPDPRDVIDHARVEFAGGVSQIGSGSCTTDAIDNHDAAIRLLGTGGQLQPDGPDGQIITNTEIVASAGGGIDRGWFGEPIDFLPTNTFTDVAQCLQSYPHPVAPGVCPDPVPCPTE